jgi:hypothetical protein
MVPPLEASKVIRGRGFDPKRPAALAGATLPPLEPNQAVQESTRAATRSERGRRGDTAVPR